MYQYANFVEAKSDISLKARTHWVHKQEDTSPRAFGKLLELLIDKTTNLQFCSRIGMFYEVIFCNFPLAAIMQF